MKVYTIGGSRNIGYHASLRLLRKSSRFPRVVNSWESDLLSWSTAGKGATVTFLLRNPSCFDEDEGIQEFVKQGKVRTVKGDALVKEDVRRGWEVAGQNVTGSSPDSDGQVDVLLFTVGELPHLYIYFSIVVLTVYFAQVAPLNSQSHVASS